MRIIAGTARGRPIKAPKGWDTRPTPDRVREALFSILGPAIAEARVLDLFAGTGALGLEALSRGAAHTTFVEHDRKAAACVRENLAVVPGAHTQVLCMSAHKALQTLATGRQCFDLVFLDPPYASDLLATCLPQIVKGALIAPGGLLVCEHGTHAAAPTPPQGCAQVDQRRYGDVSLTLFRYSEASEPSNGGP